MPVEGGDEHGDLRDEVKGFIARECDVFAGFRRGIIAAERADGGSQHVHRCGLVGYGVNEINNALRNFAAAGEVFFQCGQFIRSWQALVMKQVNDLLEAGVLRKVVDVVAAINQLAEIAAHVAQFRFGGHHAGHSLVD